MRTIKILTVFLCVLLFTHCNSFYSKEFQYYEVFPEEQMLENIATEPSHEIICTFPRDMTIVDSKLLILDSDNKQAILEYSLPELKYNRSYGVKGRGEGEFILASEFKVTPQGIITLLDGVNRAFLTFDINSKDTKCISKDKLKTSVNPALEVFKISEMLYVVKSIYSEHRVLIENEYGELIHSIFKAPEKLDNSNDYQLFDMVLDCNNDLLVGASKYGETLHIYDFKSNIESHIIGPGGVAKFDPQTLSPLSIKGFWDVKIFGDKIYTLFSGSTAEEYMYSDKIGASTILVYDLQGNPLKRYGLDRCISAFCIDVNEGLIYGLDVSKESPLCIFKI